MYTHTKMTVVARYRVYALIISHSNSRHSNTIIIRNCCIDKVVFLMTMVFIKGGAQFLSVINDTHPTLLPPPPSTTHTHSHSSDLLEYGADDEDPNDTTVNQMLVPRSHQEEATRILNSLLEEYDKTLRPDIGGEGGSR